MAAKKKELKLKVTVGQPRTRADFVKAALAKAALSTVAIGGAIYCADKATKIMENKKGMEGTDYLEAGALVAGYAAGIVVGSFGIAHAVADTSEAISFDPAREIERAKDREAARKRFEKLAKNVQLQGAPKKKAAKKKTTKKSSK